MRRSGAGFTVIELLVALAITGLVVAAGHAGLTALIDASARARAAREPVHAGAAARAMLADWLNAASLLDGNGSFWGTHRRDGIERIDRLSFTIADGGPLRRGPQRVDLWVDRDLFTVSEGLLAELTPIRGGPPAPTETLSLARSGTGLSLRYLVMLDGRERWVDEWQSTTQLPRAVELRLTRIGRVRLGGASDGIELPPLLRLPLVVAVGVGGAHAD